MQCVDLSKIGNYMQRRNNVLQGSQLPESVEGPAFYDF